MTEQIQVKSQTSKQTQTSYNHDYYINNRDEIKKRHKNYYKDHKDDYRKRNLKIKLDALNDKDLQTLQSMIDEKKRISNI